MMKTSHRILLWLVVFVALAGWRPVMAQQQSEVPEGESVDPSRYFTLMTPHFRIHYPEDLAGYTKEISEIAETSFQDVTSRIKWTPKGRVHLVLSNKNDQSNGFAAVAPYNYVFLFVAPPQANSSLDNYKEYWRLLLQHELTHIVHIDQHHGIVSPFRFLFGKIINPNAATPTWMREGMAVYEESLLDDKYGRNNADYSDMIIRAAIYDNDFPRIDQINGSSQHFPAGTGPYLFGGKFFDWLADTYGEERMYKFQKEYSSTLWLYSINNKARRVYGKKFYALWDEFHKAQVSAANEMKTNLENLGLTSLEPVLANTKEKTSFSLYAKRPHSTGYAYYEKSFDEGPRIFIYPEANAEPILIKKQALGQMNFSDDGRYLAFSSYASIEPKANHAEVFLYDLKEKKMGRMFDAAHKKFAMHVTDPAWSPVDEGNRWLVMVQQFVDTDQLLIFDAVEKKNYIITQAETKTQFSNPRFSPDGEHIVVSRKDPTGARDIVVYTKTGDFVAKITDDDAVDDFPIFSQDGKQIYFTSYHTGISNVFAYDVATDRVSQISNVLTGVFQPVLSEDGGSILVETYGSQGNSIQKFAIPMPAPLNYASYSVREGQTAPVAWFGQAAVVSGESIEKIQDKQQLQAIYTKNRRGDRPLNLDLLDASTETSAPDATSDVSAKPENSAPTEEVKSAETEARQDAATPAEKNVASEYKTVLEGKPSQMQLSTQHPEGKKDYNPLPMLLLPRYVLPSVVASENTTLFSLTTGNFDPLNRHVWNASVNYRTDADFVGAAGSYIYKRFNPMFFVGAIRYAVDWGDIDNQEFFEERLQGYSGLSYGLKSHRFTLSYFYESRDELNGAVDSDLLFNMEPYAGARFRYTFGKWHEFADSISKEDGVFFKLGADYVDELLGSHDVNEEIVTTGDFRFFLEMPWSEHHVLALRAAAGWKFGDPQINGVFRLGGPFGEGVGAAQLSNRVFPMRGLPGIALAGDRVFLGSAEYRIPLSSNVNRGIGTWPIFLNKAHLALFADVGDITFEEYDTILRSEGATADLFSRLMIAPGAELRGDFVIGFGLPLTMRLGYAVILTNVDRVDSLQDPITGSSISNGTIYTQIGVSF